MATYHKKYYWFTKSNKRDNSSRLDKLATLRLHRDHMVNQYYHRTYRQGRSSNLRGRLWSKYHVRNPVAPMRKLVRIDRLLVTGQS